LHDYVMSNQQQQNAVPVQAQMVNSSLAPTSLPLGASSHSVGGSQQQLSFNSQTSASRPRRRGCYICNDFGHIAASCAFNDVNNQPVRYWNRPCQATGASGPREQNNASTADTFVIRGTGTQVKDEYVYIDIIIDGECHLTLIDTGCQLNLLPPSLVGERHVQPSSEKLFAANGSLLRILGTVELPVTIGGHNSVIRMFVTPDIRKPMLSFGWLQENQVCWDFTSNALFMHGVLIPLQTKKAP